MSLQVIFIPYDQIQEDVHDLYSGKKYTLKYYINLILLFLLILGLWLLKFFG